MENTTWGVVCITETSIEDGGYYESIYGEYNSYDEAVAGLKQAVADDQVMHENDPARSESYDFEVLNPEELYEWYGARR